MFTVVVEIVPASTRGVSTAFFIFVMNVVAGNIIEILILKLHHKLVGTLGILIEWVGDAIGLREAMYLFFPGLIALDSVLFFITSLPLYFKSKKST